MEPQGRAGAFGAAGLPKERSALPTAPEAATWGPDRESLGRYLYIYIYIYTFIYSFVHFYIYVSADPKVPVGVYVKADIAYAFRGSRKFRDGVHGRKVQDSRKFYLAHVVSR